MLTLLEGGSERSEAEFWGWDRTHRRASLPIHRETNHADRMTLLLAIRGPDHMVVLSDGLSLKLEGDDLVPTRTDLTKQFAVDGLPVVIAHHGQNKLGAIDVGSMLSSERFQDVVRDAWPRGLNHVLGHALLELDGAVTQSLETNPKRKSFGLWFTGLWPCTDKPDIAELMWTVQSPSQTRVRCHPLNDFSLGGGGAKFLAKRLKTGLDDPKFEPFKNGRPESSMELVKVLYREALTEQAAADEELFGGQATMSLITPDGVDLGPVDIEPLETRDVPSDSK